MHPMGRYVQPYWDRNLKTHGRIANLSIFVSAPWRGVYNYKETYRNEYLAIILADVLTQNRLTTSKPRTFL
ncbi:hypothetical protein MGG_17496 [Pyricularia oryzae 70-15]|uniref:Uncharacterized protein n=3 Tax=Pyricularia oryzae TaxID=318829 RepID=G4NDK5_PYRO7|nr:uncharacterized protein MGG_17496 [Pyricularia oryzae 70-15]EHA49290.1 hypothetical protein MGG_17496 [Pyricularia oryzae 70-15]ELQ32443.1 hypothetical protein OOU_Y34scaffold01159g2 [Pyricularia oryzae Y34]